MVGMVDSPRDEYLRGHIAFDEAVGEVTGLDNTHTRAVLADVLGELAHSIQAPNPPLSAREGQLLDEAGMPDDPGAAASALLRSRTLAQEVTETALTVSAAAEHLGVTDARVRQMISQRKLWAFDPGVRGGRRLPAAQFTAEGRVPYLDRLLPHIPVDLHPLAFHRLLTATQPDLEIDGQPVSLVDWVAVSGDDTERIARAVELVTAARWEAA